jgi:hypothetical protein
MQIDILYFEGCPNHGPTVERVKRIVANMAWRSPWRKRRFPHQKKPSSVVFLGLPRS